MEFEKLKEQKEQYLNLKNMYYTKFVEFDRAYRQASDELEQSCINHVWEKDTGCYDHSTHYTCKLCQKYR
jgi:hypothetical protein